MEKMYSNYYNTGYKKINKELLGFTLQLFYQLLPEEKFTTAHEFGKPARKPRVAKRQPSFPII